MSRVHEIKSIEELNHVISSPSTIIDDNHHENNDNGSKPIILCFSSENCGPCKRIKPVYNVLSNYYNEILFFRIDADEINCDGIELVSLPTFRIYINGIKIDEMIGDKAHILQNMIQKYTNE